MESGDIKFRSAKEVAIRCVILNAILFVGHGGAASLEIKELLKSWGIIDFVSEKEDAFLSTESHNQSELDEMSWKRESLFTLLWSLNEVKELSAPDDESDIPSEIYVKLEKNPLLWVNEAEFRKGSEILEAGEDIYEIHWSIRDAILHNREIPNNYIIAVVYQRHHALNWVRKYNNDNWDNISVDT